MLAVMRMATSSQRWTDWHANVCPALQVHCSQPSEGDEEAPLHGRRKHEAKESGTNVPRLGGSICLGECPSKAKEDIYRQQSPDRIGFTSNMAFLLNAQRTRIAEFEYLAS